MSPIRISVHRMPVLVFDVNFRWKDSSNVATEAHGLDRSRAYRLARMAAAVANAVHKVLFHLAAYSGLRSGELAGLHVQDLDFARGVIRVRRSVWKGMEVAPKTRKGYRDVRIDSTSTCSGSILAAAPLGASFNQGLALPLRTGTFAGGF